MNRLRSSNMLLLVLLVAGLTGLLGRAEGTVQQDLKARFLPLGTVLEPGSQQAPKLEQIERFAVDTRGNVVLCDKKLNRVFKLSPQGKTLWRADGAGAGQRFGFLRDVAVDAQDRVWVVDLAKKSLVLFSPQGRFVRSVAVAQYPQRLVVNRSQELIVNPGRDSHLFDVYSPEGKYLRSFGRKLPYPSKAADFMFNTGGVAVDPRGDVYISFLYPPLVRAYGGNGKLLWESKIPFARALPQPDIQIQNAAGSPLSAAVQFHAASLDLTRDEAGRLFTLSAGVPWGNAAQSGSQRVDVFSNQGRHLGQLQLPAAATRMAYSAQTLFLLEPSNSLHRFMVGFSRPSQGRSRMR